MALANKAPSPGDTFHPNSKKTISKISSVLNDLLTNNIMFVEDWNELDYSVREDLTWSATQEELMAKLVGLNLLTQYQADRILAGTRFGLVLGNYRILERLGAGGMGVVFKGEHFIMRRLAAIKVLPFRGPQDDYLLKRFRSELRTVAALNHPNIVSAFDGGVEFSGDHSYPDIYYFVMEHIQGEDLEEVVKNRQLGVNEAVWPIYQICLALEEANKHGLVHRDIKPSNIMLTKNGAAKLLDFGLVRRIADTNGMTDPGTTLGTIDYLAPEQAKDATKVDIRADIYSLGGTLYYALTGRTPFPQMDNGTMNLIARINQEPPSIRTVRSDIPAALDEIIRRMMANRPEHRFQDPYSLLQALYPYTVTASSHDHVLSPRHAPLRPDSQSEFNRMKVVVLDDDPDILSFLKHLLSTLDVDVETVTQIADVMAKAQHEPIDLLITDIELGDGNGLQLIQQLKELPLQANMRCIVISGAYSDEQMAAQLSGQIMEVIRKPFSNQVFLARVKNVLHSITQYDESIRTLQMLVTVNEELEAHCKSLTTRAVQTRSVIVQSFLRLIEKKINEPVAHLRRVRLYVRRIAQAAQEADLFPELHSEAFVGNLEDGSMFHDIGKIAMSDQLLAKEGAYTEEERVMMQEHTLIGAQLLQDLQAKYREELPFLPLAVDIARCHHERWDGTGYPERLKGEAIPLAARVVALADTYDALRCERKYRPAMSHSSAMRILVSCSEGAYDPNLHRLVMRLDKDFNDIFEADKA